MAGSTVRQPSASRVVPGIVLAILAALSGNAAAAALPGPGLPYLGLADPARARHLHLDPVRALTAPDPLHPPVPVAPGHAAGASPVPEDRLWWDGFGLPVLNSAVHTAIVHEGSLIVGGEFTFAAGRRVGHIARWDGTGWSALGDGLDGPVQSLAVHEGRLIAGGEFFRSGTIPTGCVAQWDGTRWSALGEPAVGCVHALSRHGASLVAGGCFVTGTGVRNVGAWDGLAWRPLGDGLGGHVLALASHQGEVVAGGAFHAPGTVAPSTIARFDGASWQPLGSGISGGDQAAVHALAVLGDELIAGGWFDRAGDTPVRSIARWNGARWDSLPGSPAGVYQTFLVEGDELVAAGFLHERAGGPISIARWNRASWITPAEPMWGVRAIAMFRGSLVAGGYFQEAWPHGEVRRPVPWLGRLEGTRWAGFESWSSAARGLFVSGGVDDFLEFRGRLVAAGSFQYAGSAGGWLPYHGLAQWDGRGWGSMSDLTGSVQALVSHEGDLIVGGSFFMPRAGAHGAARWDGSRWSPMGRVGPLRALAVYRGELYGAGYFGDGADGEEGVAKWDGTRWSMVGGGFPFVPYETMVGTLAVHDDRLIAAGRFERAGSVEARNIAAWDGHSWQPMGSGRGHEVQTLAVYRGALHAGGAGPASGSSSALARWNGSAWQEIDVRGCTYVTALHVTDDRLFAGGLFGEIEGVPARNVAVWDGTEWSALGSGLDGQPRSFGEFQGRLFVGGWFTTAGGKPSFGIARWDGLRASPRASPSTAGLGASPNPFVSHTELAFTLSTAGRVCVEIYDVRGRRVDTVLDRFVEAGPALVTWRPSAAVRTPPGLYLARVSANGRQSVARIVYAP